MKSLILAAGLTLIALPAFAAGAQQQTAAATDTQQQKHSYSYNSDESTGSATAIRNANLRHAAQERSVNSRAAYAGAVHYY